MIKKIVLFVTYTVIFSNVLSAHPLHNVGNHLRRHALKYAGGAVATAGVGNMGHNYAAKHHDQLYFEANDRLFYPIEVRRKVAIWKAIADITHPFTFPFYAVSHVKTELTKAFDTWAKKNS